MNLTEEIFKSETEYLPALESFFMMKWIEMNLSSHDLSHHRRVWKNAKELLQNIGLKEISKDPFFVKKLMIACYLHDIGMAVDQGERHGLHSKSLCEQYLSMNNFNRSDYQDVLAAIENHDNKEYSDSPSDKGLLTLLSVADDMDAFGYIGIYRYIEIYLARGIQPDKIGHMIRENASRRFKNLESIFGRFPELVEKHRMRYLILENFFIELGSELESF